MAIRRLMASVTAILLLFALAVPVAAHGGKPAANAYTVTPLVTGPSPDGDLVNAWGLARSPTSPWWIANNGTDVSTLYHADGSKLVVPRVPIRRRTDRGRIQRRQCRTSTATTSCSTARPA